MTCLLHDGRPLTIQGFAALYGIPAIVEQDMTETFLPGAFRACLARGARFVIATWNHFASYTWASVAAGTLRLWESEAGLSFEANVDANCFGLGIARYVAEGSAGASVLFAPLTAEKSASETVIKAAYLRDVCVTASPAYPTACWLGHANPATLPPYVRELRECWNVGREAHRIAQIGCPQESYGNNVEQPRAQAAAKPTLTEENPLGPPPAGMTMEEWLDFGHRIAWAASQYQSAELQRTSR